MWGVGSGEWGNPGGSVGYSLAPAGRGRPSFWGRQGGRVRLAGGGIRRSNPLRRCLETRYNSRLPGKAAGRTKRRRAGRMARLAVLHREAKKWVSRLTSKVASVMIEGCLGEAPRLLVV